LLDGAKWGRRRRPRDVSDSTGLRTWTVDGG
jgi:hypothetical protein